MWEGVPAQQPAHFLKSLPFSTLIYCPTFSTKSPPKIRLLGGIANVQGGTFPKGSVAVADAYKYNAGSNTWSKLPNLPAARGGGAAVVLQNKLHFFNGAQFDGTNGGFQRDMTDHWVLDLSNTARGWKGLKGNSLGRNHVGGVVFDGQIYAIGGQFFEEEGCSNQKLAEVYNPNTNKWKRIADLPVGTGHISPSTIATEHGIIVVGGVTDKNRGCKPSGYKRSQLLFYNPTTNAWTDIPSAVAGASMVSGLINGEIYAQHGSGVRKITLEWSSTNLRNARALVQEPSVVYSRTTPRSTRLVAAAVLAGSATVLLLVGIVARRRRFGTIMQAGTATAAAAATAATTIGSITLV